MIYIQTYIKALVDASSWDSCFFSIKDQKQGKCIMTRTSATEDTNRKKRNEMKRWKNHSLYRLTISSCHHTRGEAAGQQAKGPTVQSSAHYTCIVTYIQWNAPKSHHQLTDGFGKQNIYDRGKKSSHAAVCRCVRIQAQGFHHLKYLSSCHKRSTIRD